jgi:peptide deformylase
MQIVQYSHPALRWKSSDVTRIDDTLRATIQEMFRLMYAAKGIGLAANQVGLPLRFFIVNLSGDAENTEEELVFINPDIKNRRGQEEGEEGCLSLPGLYADVKRAAEIVVEAFDLDGQPFQATLDELAARVVQHESDHLDGVLFIDRIDEFTLAELQPRLDDFTAALSAQRESGEIEPDDVLLSELKRIGEQGHLD